ncbi:MAG TPA: hypothetical protein VK821_02070 [Dehalococcoidia bacterium]|nr:hypothetical protein [Dehalococcoidia bacterium]
MSAGTAHEGATTRRTFGTAKGRRGVPARQTQDLLGHRGILTTQAYVSLVHEEGEKMMESCGRQRPTLLTAAGLLEFRRRHVKVVEPAHE